MKKLIIILSLLIVGCFAVMSCKTNAGPEIQYIEVEKTSWEVYETDIGEGFCTVQISTYSEEYEGDEIIKKDAYIFFCG